MIISVKIADEVYEKYGRQNTKNPREAVERVLETYADVGSGKVLIVTGEALATLQKLMGQLDSPAQLVERVKKVMSFPVGDIPITLSESQRKGLQDLAAHRGQDALKFAEQQINKALSNVLGV